MISFRSITFLLVFSLCNLIPGLIQAQEKGQDAVYLKNGSILYGKILEYTEGKEVKIEIIGHNVLVFPVSEVEKTAYKLMENANYVPQKGIILGSSLSFLGGSNNSLGFNFSTDYQFANRMSTGLGTGVEFFTYQVLPVYAEFNYSVLKSRLTPFFYAKAGYSFPLSKPTEEYWTSPDYKGGILASAGMGIRKDFQNNFSLLFSLGYRYQKLRTVTQYNPWYYGQNIGESMTRIDHLKRINVSVGFLFR